MIEAFAKNYQYIFSAITALSTLISVVISLHYSLKAYRNAFPKIKASINLTVNINNELRSIESLTEEEINGLTYSPLLSVKLINYGHIKAVIHREFFYLYLDGWYPMFLDYREPISRCIYPQDNKFHNSRIPRTYPFTIEPFSRDNIVIMDLAGFYELYDKFLKKYHVRSLDKL